MNLSALYKRYIRIVPDVKSYVLASVLVFVLGMVITLYSWHTDKQRAEFRKDNLINEQVASVEADIVNRLTVYEQILKGVNGLFEVSEPVNQESLRRFIKQYDIQNSYPGIQSIGYAEYVKAQDLPAYLDRMRSEGKTDIKVVPEGERPEYVLLTYSYSTNGAPSRASGYDVLSFPARKKLALEARDSGNIGISEKLILIGDQIDESDETGFTMYSPIYKKDAPKATVEERRKNLVGYVYAGYRSSDFFDKSINDVSMAAYTDIQIFDSDNPTPENMLYQSTDFSKFPDKEMSNFYNYNVFNRSWTLRFANPTDNGAEDNLRSNIILFGGTTLSLAITGFLFVLMLNRARAIVYAEQEETQRAKDDLLSLASHQLRTPATAVKQYLGMILEGYTGKVNKKMSPALQKAYDSNERQLEIINQILYVAKADAGRLSIERSNFDVSRLIDEVLLDLNETIKGRQQTVEFIKPKGNMEAHADKAAIRMVIENLISNASKYSYDKSKIIIELKKTNKDLVVSITDEGVGISQDDHDKLFKKFSRVDNDLSLQVGGTGIGLYIDKVLIELHNGKISVKSEVDRGSTFTISLPANQKNDNILTDEIS